MYPLVGPQPAPSSGAGHKRTGTAAELSPGGGAGPPVGGGAGRSVGQRVEASGSEAPVRADKSGPDSAVRPAPEEPAAGPQPRDPVSVVAGKLGLDGVSGVEGLAGVLGGEFGWSRPAALEGLLRGEATVVRVGDGDHVVIVGRPAFGPGLLKLDPRDGGQEPTERFEWSSVPAVLRRRAVGLVYDGSGQLAKVTWSRLAGPPLDFSGGSPVATPRAAPAPAEHGRPDSLSRVVRELAEFTGLARPPGAAEPGDLRGLAALVGGRLRPHRRVGSVLVGLPPGAATVAARGGGPHDVVMLGRRPDGQLVVTGAGADGARPVSEPELTEVLGATVALPFDDAGSLAYVAPQLRGRPVG